MKPQQLRNSILQLAMEGKIVEQRLEEGTGEELYQLIQEEKQELIKAGKLKKQKELSEIAEDEIPFEIPTAWKWVKLGNVISYFMGKTPPRAEPEWWGGDIPWVSISDMSDYGFIKMSKELVSRKAINEKFTRISSAGTLLMSFKLTVGRTSILNIDAVHNEAIISIFPYIDPYNIFRDYLFYFLPIFVQWAASKNAIKGKTLNSKSISNLLIPLPPIAEQKRILEKIKNLLPMVDRYEYLWTKLDKLNKNLPLNMQKSLLQEALQGKISEQKVEDGTGEDLYIEILKEKNNFKVTGIIKEVNEVEDYPFDIPDTWKWVKLGNIIKFSIGRTPPRGEAEWWGNDIPWVSISDMSDYGYIKETKEMVSQKAIDKKFSNISKAGTLLMSFKLTVGRTSILDCDAVHNEAIISIIPFIDCDNSLRDYLFYVLPFLTQWGDSRNAIKGKTLNSKSISNLLVPLPPLREQKCIVEKIEKILPLINQYRIK